MAQINKVLEFLDRLSDRQRWIAAVPVGIVLSFVAVGLVQAAFRIAGSERYPTPPGVAENLTLNFVAALTRTLFPALISPRPWLVGIIMFTLDLLLRIGPFAYAMINFEYLRPRGPVGGLAIAVAAAGGMIGLSLVHRVTHATVKPVTRATDGADR